MPHIIFVQVSDTLMMQQGDGKWIDNYFATCYKNMLGYVKPEHFMEIPYWVAIADGMLRERYTTELHIVTDVSKSIGYLREREGFILCSALDANVEILCQLCAGLPSKTIYMGGYVNPDIFHTYSHVTFLRSMGMIGDHLTINSSATPNYALFSGQQTIPRLTMSRGCLFNCAMCTVPKELEVIPNALINQQLEAFHPLRYTLIYLDDKSFSQAKNWEYLRIVRELARRQQNNFLGFIVQTTVSLADKQGRLAAFKDMGVRYVELGVESLDPIVLKKMRKPYTLPQLERVMQEALRLGIPIIPNLVFGTPGEDLGACVRWVHKYREQIPVVNPNFLASMFGADMVGDSVDLPHGSAARDGDQTEYAKSWLSEEEILMILQAVRAICYITNGGDFVPSRYAEALRKTPIEKVLHTFGVNP